MMKKIIAAAGFSLLFAAQAMSADQSVVGSYNMTWGNGKTGTYEIHAIDDKAAKVTYSYGGKAKTKVLKVKKNRIVGGGWFPTATLGGGGVSDASHSGGGASVSRN
ncbi:MAG: hypothetical protein P1U75_02530 [Antarcticimicrobium sp.]|uniref:hypothetical protein n=1 Tax=Antarcticimicrobium sp. TaxID=2824147 RepID=UPI0026284835|nr:hypothetical protein [Antarcticimicrobium sp.]MDF1715539.1 hypothetical protein [Antarcticimicrobium sp.]